MTDNPLEHLSKSLEGTRQGISDVLHFEQNEEGNWLRRRFAVFNDILRETPVYQEVFEEGFEKGIEKGRQEALRQELHRQYYTLLRIVLERFPKIVQSVSKPIEALEDSAILSSLIVKMSTVQTAEEAKQLLFDVTGDEEN